MLDDIAGAGMADIFISYASPDRETARVLAQRLAELGYSVWWDRTIPPGRQFDEVIQEALHAARCVLVLWSAQSVRSNWVKTEAAEALALDRLVPALIEDVPPPMEFKRIQAANLSGWTGDAADPEYRNLLASVQALLQHAPASAATSAAPQRDAAATIRPARAGRSLRTVAIAAALVLSVVVALVLFLRSADRRDLSAGAPPPPANTGTTWSTSVERPPVAEPAPAAPAADPAPGTPGRRVNLLAAENGGEMVVAANERWLSTVDGKEDTYAWTDTGEAVFAFQGGRPATFDTFAVLIPGTADGNLREFELLASNDGPTGHFDSIGVFTTQNLRVMKNPYQEFRFPAVKAKYLKVRSLKPHGSNSGAVFAYEFRLLGDVE
jgi:hypothetical protein